MHQLDESIADYSRRPGAAPCSPLPAVYVLWRTESLNLSVRHDLHCPLGSLRHLGWDDSAAPSARRGPAQSARLGAFPLSLIGWLRASPALATLRFLSRNKVLPQAPGHEGISQALKSQVMPPAVAWLNRVPAWLIASHQRRRLFWQWAMPVSNQRHPACKAGALPLS